MALTSLSGPLVVGFGSGANDANPEKAPSMFAYGVGILDQRFGYLPGAGENSLTPGWYGAGSIAVLNQVPSAISAVNIAASQTPVAATALTLVAASGGGITVAQTIITASNTSVSGLLVIDGAAGTLAGSGTISPPQVTWYDPTKNIARNVRITSVGNDSTATFVVRGYDIYGFPMSETITGGNAGVASGKKAFKWIASITPAGTLSGSAVTVGTGDVYGLPLLATEWAFVDAYWGTPPVLLTANTGFTAADTTSPATSTTGDPRGTYAVQSASDGTKKLQVFVTPEPNALTSLTGVTPA